MTNQSFFDEQFKNMSHDNAVAKGAEYESCHFIECDFSSSDLSSCRFMDTTFTDCDFSNAQLIDTSFQGVAFVRCKMQGLFFTDCNTFGFEVRYENCLLNYAVFHRMNLQKIQIADSQLHHVDFSGADLSGARVSRCDLQDATFDQTNLEKADLRDSTNYVIHPESNRLRGARFSLPEAMGLLSGYGIKVDIG